MSHNNAVHQHFFFQGACEVQLLPALSKLKSASGNCFQSCDVNARWIGLLESHLYTFSALLFRIPREAVVILG